MIEAFEIGIKLALDNGVAVGIAAIRQDLDALDRAVASSAAGLLTLRRLSESGAASAPAQSPSPPLVSPSIPAPTGAAAEPTARPFRASDIAPAPLPAPSPATPIEPTPSAPRPVTAPAAAGLASQPPPVQTAAPAGQLASPRPTIPAAAAIANAAPVPARHSAPRSIPSLITVASLPEPWATGPIPIAQPEPKPTPAAPTIAPRPITLAMGRMMRSPSAAPLSTPPQPGPPPPPDADFAPMAHRQVAPAAPAPRLARPDRPDPFPPQTDSPAPSGSARDHTPGALHGELILDGVRLGRWMSDRLARAADRPQSGTTGFDPRVSPSYAGAPNGS